MCTRHCFVRILIKTCVYLCIFIAGSAWWHELRIVQPTLERKSWQVSWRRAATERLPATWPDRLPRGGSFSYKYSLSVVMITIHSSLNCDSKIVDLTLCSLSKGRRVQWRRAVRSGQNRYCCYTRRILNAKLFSWRRRQPRSLLLQQ